MMFFSVALYGVLGVLLTWSGVDIFDQPVKFIAITALVALIDFMSSIRS